MKRCCCDEQKQNFKKKKQKNLTEAWISQWNSVLCYYCKIKIKQILTNQKREVTLILPPFLNLLKCTLYGLPGHYYQDFLKIDFKRICNISIISSVTRRIQKLPSIYDGN